MKRRQFLKSASVFSWAAAIAAASRTIAATVAASPANRVRPTDPAWPTAANWERLRRQVGGRLIEVESPFVTCQNASAAATCTEVFEQLKNPYYIGDHPALTQTLGWTDAWTWAPNVYTVAAANTADVVAAVDFARAHNLRLVVKGGAHSYKGTSCSADSLLIWTRAMNQIELHDAFVPRGCAGKIAAQPAASIGAGAYWLQAYHAVTTKAGRYVQGGGCTTVGVAGLIQSGGFGSFSKNYGMAAANLLEAEIVTADGSVRIANACTNPELFWALKGGGGGSFGVLTRLTLQTHELPEYFGAVFGQVQANSPEALRRLVARVVGFYREALFNPHWGEQIRFDDDIVDISMVFHGMNAQQAREVWRPFIEWVASARDAFTWVSPLLAMQLDARHFWDASYLRQNAAPFIVTDDRPGASDRNFVWRGDREQAGQFMCGYRSAWLPASLLEKDKQDSLVDALIAASRHWEVSLHFNKGLAGAPASALVAARDTATNPAVLDAFALAIVASSSGRPAYPGIQGHEPDLPAARRHAQQINLATNALLKVAPGAGSYVSESDFFERNWQQSFWGANYPRLAAAKQAYDPEGLFFVHQGVGSERWSADGFARTAG